MAKLRGAPGPPGPPGASSSSDLLPVYRTIITAEATIASASGGAGHYWMNNASSLIVSGSVSGVSGPVGLIHLVGADYAVSGKTTKLRVRATLITNLTAPANTITAGLYSVTASGGGANLVGVTLGGAPAAIAGSTVAFASQGASTISVASDSGQFTIPADGVHLLGVQLSAAAAANSFNSLHIALQLAHV